MDVHSPQRGRQTKAESYKTTGKMSKSADSEATSLKSSRRLPHTQPPIHVRVAQNKSSNVQSQQELGTVPRSSSLPDPPRRAKSTPSATINAPHHIPPSHPPPKPLGSTSSSTSNSPNMGTRSTDTSPNVTHKPTTSSQAASISQETRPSSVQSVSSHGIAQAHRTAVQSSAQAPLKKPFYTSMSVPAVSQHLDPARQRLVDRAIRARLYLLRQMGPNRFLIGGDSPDSRFHVAIGPQSCTCNKTHCIHLLFVMLRVFKVSQNDPMLWQKQLRNYEAEGLLREFQTRLTKQRTTPKRTSKKNFQFTQRPSDNPEEGKGTSAGGPGKSGPVREQESSPKSPKRMKEGSTRSYSPNKASHSGGEESDKSDGEEDICPICLNELDEGEDLLVCSGCHNHLHQHCMDIWAGEQLRKNEDVYCPVCRAVWPYSITSSPSTSTLSPNVMPVSVPVGREGGVVKEGLRLKSISPSQFSLSEEKRQLVERLKAMFGSGPVEYLFSSDWKARETAITHISREVISFLMPQLTLKFHPRADGGQAKFGEVQEMCMQTVTYACNDSVIKVFMAGLELMRVILGYSVSPTKEEANGLQKLVEPVIPVLLTRCADAQRRVKDCSIDTLCNFCLGQEGPLSIGSACGHQSPHAVTGVRFVLQTALEGQDERVHSWHWWLGRLYFIDKMLTLFSSEFLLPQCLLSPSPDPLHGNSDSDSSSSGAGSGLVSPIDSITSDASALMVEIGSGSGSGPQSMESPHSDHDTTITNTYSIGGIGMEPIPRGPSPIPELPSVVENHLLMQVWYFAAKSTHITHHKVGKVARRVIIRIAKLLRDNPYSLEIVHDVVARCHRTQAEGLLDRVLQAREKPHDNTLTVTEERGKREERVSPSHRKKGAHRSTIESERKEDNKKQMTLGGVYSADVDVVDIESSLKGISLRISKLEHSAPSSSSHQSDTSNPSGGHGGREKRTSEYVGSDDSFRSAMSDLEGEESRMERKKEKEEDLSSATNSNDSKSGETASRSSSRGSNSSGHGTMEEGGSATGNGASMRPLSSLIRHPIYKRQSTADSAFSTDSSLDGSYFACKHNIEEEEAAAEARVRSMLPQDMPHPALTGLTPPTPEVLIHIQRSSSGGFGREETEGTDDNQSAAYVEGVHWAKGKLLGTGAFCSCYLARDIENGTIFAVKQVSYSRNTKAQEEEELKRLKDEIGMMGRMNHPNIVRCLGATQHDGHINVFIEWMAGGCLDQILHDFGRPFAERVLVNYARQITHGIVYLHENGVIHRDLKGGNILCDSTGRRIRIADFGASARLATHTTGPGEFQQMEGTVAFMAPEVVRGGSIDESGQSTGYGRKCDVWSIGCVIIQMATGKPPWVGSYDVHNKFQLIFKIGQTTEPPPFPDFSNPSLKDFTIRCLEVKPEDRPTSSELLKHPLFTSL